MLQLRLNQKCCWLLMAVVPLLAINYMEKVSAATDYNRYLFQIFHKYGNGTTITFEGLEHLMYSLGLGYLEFEPTHTIATHRTLVPDANNSTGKQSYIDLKGNNTTFESISTEFNSSNGGDDYQLEYLRNAPHTNFTDNKPSSKIQNDVLIDNKLFGKSHNKVDGMTYSGMAMSKITRMPDDDIEVDMELQQLWPKGLFQEFRGMHDPRHRHPRNKENEYDKTTFDINNACLTPKSLLRLIFNDEDLHKDENNLSRYRKQLPRNQNDQYKETKKYGGNNHPFHANNHDTEEEYNEFVNTVQLTPLAFLKLCPALLMQIDQQVCVRAVTETLNADEMKERLWQAWFYAGASVFVLSASGLLGILIIPLMKTFAYREILDFLISVAIGTLSGDALMHLLPHALQSNHGSNDITDRNVINRPQEIHDEIASRERHVIWIYACTFFSALFMYLLEHIGPLLKSNIHDHNGHHQHNQQHYHIHSGHNHSYHEPLKTVGNTPEKALHNNDKDNHELTALSIDNTRIQSHATDKAPSSTITGSTTNIAIDKPVTTAVTCSNTYDMNEPRERNVMMRESELDNKKPNNSALTPLAFMVIIGDALHNLTDGLAIGAAFGTDSVTGIATAFAVLCHELPHELGDFALLLQTGVSVQRVIFLNIVSSILSFIGMAIGLLVTGLQNDMSQWIYAATAGSFLYIAFADLMPSLSNNDMSLESSTSKISSSRKRFWIALIKVFGIFIGGCLMIIIALNEDDIQELFK